MLLGMLLQGQVFMFAAIVTSLVFSLTLHEYGHALSAKLLGDRTAEQMGRLTLNPIAHIDPIGLLMVITVGFGYAKPVPVNTRLLTKSWGGAAVAAAGPFMNFLIALVSVNLLVLGLKDTLPMSEAAITLLSILAPINLLLMLFNLLPIGPLDGHYVMSWLLPPRLSYEYDRFNAYYGTHILLGLILLSVLGVPIFSFLMNFSQSMMQFLVIV